MLWYYNLYQCIIPAATCYINVDNRNLLLFNCSLDCSLIIHIVGAPYRNTRVHEDLWKNGLMTQMPVVVLTILTILSIAFVVLVVVMAIGIVTHRVSIASSHEHDDSDDLSDDTRALLAMIPGASIVVDEHDAVVRCSPAAYQLGVVEGDAIIDSEVLKAVRQARRSGGKRQFDVTTNTPERYAGGDRGDGGRVVTRSVTRPNWLKVTVARISDAFVIVLVSDVSEVVRFGHVRDSFITNVSEQLLKPTEALGQLADVLERDDLDHEQLVDDARQVRSSCNKLNHMVSDLLLLIRAQEPITPSSANRLNVMDVLRVTMQRLEPEAQRADVRLNLKGDDALVVNGQADQLDSAVTKLVENAIGYSQEGGIVNVSAVATKDGEHAAIRVIDQGRGIAKQDQSRIFERFYRGSSQTARTADGVGLGLAIVKHVALTHHGDVSVWSAPGQGSTFTLTLPLAH